MKLITTMDEEIVISGISGRFPESGNMQEFRDNLLNNNNLVTVNERRFKPGMYGIPEGFGTLKEIDKFDADFFRVFPAQASRMDPQLRMTLETTFEAMQDAGVNPTTERESRTGVFLGVCASEANNLWNSRASKVEGATMTGCSHSMFANRVSYTFDFNGPSCAFDTACSTSIVALEAAVSAIRAGKCDSAIVTASTLILTPHTTLQFQKLGMLAPNSACKSFDSSGNGYVRSEAVATIYLQKKSVAKRSYASILHVKTNTDGFKDIGITFPSSALQMELLRDVYEESGIDKDEVVYVESHGTGTAAGDPQEFLSISKTFASNQSQRKQPLYMGSVKSNMGHAEGASGLCGIAKLVIALQEGVIPANLHFGKPHYNMKALRDGKIKIVDRNTPLLPGLVALNSFGFGGVNTHVVFKPNEVHRRDLEKFPINKIPRVITMSGRTDNGLRSTLKQVGQHDDPNLYHLFNESHSSGIPGHRYRGFSLPNDNMICVEENVKDSAGVWFVFNGMGSQWVGMGLGLLEIPVFAKSIEISALTLTSSFNYDLYATLRAAELKVNDPTSCFVAIAAIQIGIVDMLTSLGIHPRGFIGHSAGEMICAYVDGCLSAEETISCAFLRGNSLETKSVEKQELTTYGMAVVGDSWEHIHRNCFKGLYPACHNGLDSVTVSGPTDILAMYVEKLKGEKKLAKQVDSCGVAFHSPYIEDASKLFLDSLKKLVKSPLARSRKWVSTSVPKKSWSSETALRASPEYFNNNFKSPVLFYEALMEIPENSTVIEIGPSGLLKGLIKKAAPSCTVISVQSRDSKNGLLDFVTALGHMHIAQVEMNVNKLYADVEYPVPLGTPMISPLIQWDHDTSWDVPIYGQNGEFLEGVFEVDMEKEQEKYLFGHQIQGRFLYPATGYLCLAWKSFAQMHHLSYEDLPVVFENVRFNRVTVLRETGKIEFRVNISDLSGNFEIKEGGAAVVSGRIRRHGDAPEHLMHDYDFCDIQVRNGQEDFSARNTGAKDIGNFDRGGIYKQLRFSGYEYMGDFKGIRKCDASGKYFRLDWNENWVPFLDACFQTALGIFDNRSGQTELPTEIQKLVINPKLFLEFVANNQASIKESGVFVLCDKSTDLIRCPGIEICGFKTTAVGGSGRRESPPTLAPYQFTHFLEDDARAKGEATVDPVIQCVTIIMENIKSSLITTAPDIIEFTEHPEAADSLKISRLIREDFATPDINYSLFTDDCKEDLIAKYARSNISLQPIETIPRDMNLMDQRFDILILDNHMFIHIATDYIKKGGFILCKLKKGPYTRDKFVAKLGPKYNLIVHRETDTHVVFLGRKSMKPDLDSIKFINVSTRDLSWVTDARDMMVHQEQLTIEKLPLPLIYLVSNGLEEDDSGVMGLTLCLRKEPLGQHIRAIFSRKNIPIDFENPSPQLQRILALDLCYVVVNEDGSLGTYVHSPIKAQNLRQHFENVFLGMDTVGDLSTLRWIQGCDFSSFAPSQNWTPVEVHVAALNFKDIMLSSGNLQPEKLSHLPFTVESPLGIEFSGVTQIGRRVLGFSDGQSLSTSILANMDWIWDIPSGWSFEEAATVPVVYSTVYLTLVMRGNIQEGDSILIHAGAGGVGLAAIRVALSYNCIVFTTVSCKEKIAHIRKTFPQIPESHIGYSRDTSFETMVRNLTHGRGVDLVLNSLAGDKLEASIRCLARHGRFLEIGKVDLVSNKSLGMRLFLQDASYHGVMLDSLWDARPSTREKLKTLLQHGLDSGVVQPLPFRSFSHEQVEPAFRYLGQGRHIGKVLVSFQREKSPVIRIPAFPRVYFDPMKSYIIIGGLGGVGLEFVNWMVTRYARKIIITSRSGITTAYQTKYIRIWREQGVIVKILQLDASEYLKAVYLVKETEGLGPLGGLFNLAMHLHIGLVKDQTEEGFASVMGPKVNLTRHLDQLTRKMCPELDHFVVFSSVAAAFGFDGQSNYGQANSAGERIIEQRRRDGLPGKAIQWGPIGEVGAWHDGYNADFNQTSFHGSGVQSIYSAIKSLDILLSHPAPVILSRRNVEAGFGAVGGTTNLGVVDRVAHILGHTSSSRKLNPNAKLTELGMDSVMSMEVRQILEQDFNLTLTAIEIRGCSLKQLEEMAQNNPKNKLTAPKSAKNQAATAGMFQLNFIKTMSRSRFEFKECVYAINDLAETRFAQGKGKTPHPGGTIFIINSIEGPDVLKLLGSLLHLPAYTMQMATEAPLDDGIAVLEEYYFKKMKEVEPEGPYVIIGYSAGIFVGIELALRLESMGEIQKLILLDMSPARMRAVLEENFGPDRSNLDETDIMIVMMSQIFGLDRYDIENILRKEPTLQKRMEKISEILKTIFDEEIDVEKMQKVISTKGKTFLHMFDEYRPSGTLNGKVVLVKTTQNLISYDSTEFWGLEEFCKETPIVETMDTTHSYLVTEPTVRQVANCINND